MTFQKGQRTNSPWRKQNFFASEMLTCEYAPCGARFSRQRSAHRGAHVFCSSKCAGAFRSVAVKP